MADEFYLTNRVSSWDNKVISTASEPPRFSQNVHSVQLSPSNYVVPRARNSSQVYPQQYRQSTNQPIQTKSSSPSESASDAKHVTLITRLIGVLVGIIVAGIPLIAVTILYVQLSSSSTSNSTATNSSSSSSSGSSSGTAVLPSQCTSYGTFNDGTHLVTYTSCCSSSDCSLGTWYRVTGAAGTRLVTTPVSINSCGTNYPVWFNASLPSISGSTTSGTGCCNYGGNICHPSYSSYPVLATNCSGFYVFYLPSLSCCCNYPRYCTV